MTNKDNQRYIYIRSTNERVPVSKEEFDNYYRDINAYRRKKQRHGECSCTEGQWLKCDMDCLTCAFCRAGNFLSLDYTVSDSDGNEEAFINMLPDEAAFFEDVLADAQELTEIIDRLKELMPEAIRYGLLRQEGYTGSIIANMLGIPNSTLRSRLEKAKKILAEEFPTSFKKII